MEEKNTKKSEAALREEKVLEFWRENKIFEKSLEQTRKGKEFVFYEGPPTANGKPGIHHLIARAFKDAIPRYKTMQGYHVRRKGGWDTHGLPVELQVEKKLGLNSKKAIEEYGIAKFNQECKESVWEYLETWNKFTERSGYWVDQENPYVTYHNDFIESVWSVVKKTDEEKLLYKDYKVVPWCPRCGTALSSHELAQGYEDVKDLSLYVKFKVKGQENTYILAWTTTPWTLPGNIAVAVGEDIDYVKIKKENEVLILAKARIAILGDGYEILSEIKGKDLIGLEYEPLFPYLADLMPAAEKSKLEKAYKVYGANFVTTEDGTGVVHTAVMYGQDDFELGTKIGLPKFHMVNQEGNFVKGAGFLEGRFVKEKDETGKPTLDVDIIKYLQEKNFFFNKENYQHSYPHCWRCKTPLIYYARDSWYIRMSDPKIKRKLIDENQKINWEPSHIRDGRFGEWLREIKDWAISRERYWGTPLPIWVSEDGERLVADSVDTLKKYSQKSNNEYYVARHGQAESNVKNILNSNRNSSDPVTDAGMADVTRNAKKLKIKFDYIFCSPLPRTKQTAELICEILGFEKKEIIFDERLREIEMGELEGKSIRDYAEFFSNTKKYFTDKLPEGESQQDIYRRAGEFIYSIERDYKNKKVLIVTHGDISKAIFLIARGLVTQKVSYESDSFQYLDPGEVRKLDFSPIPHDQDFKLDLHRPYVDEIVLEKDGKKFKRVKEVMDVWLDSGAMPFAQDHYPFENKKWVDGKGYPADYICEAIDQTRGWFYTLHAVGMIMGRGKAFKNVICLGHILDAQGKKMSKSLGNIVDPWEMIEKYGVDTLRLWMFSVNQPGESKNFDEKTVQLLQQQVFGLLYNVLAFYELYRDKNLEENKKIKSKNILDQWILNRLNELVQVSTENLDNYKLLEPVRAIRDFVGDLSTWYLRRSRERIKEGDSEARATLYCVLKTLSQILAPFAPFAAENIWLQLKTEKDAASVHLAEWPNEEKVNSKVLESMRVAREICTEGNAIRQKAGIPVRQPLARFEVKDYSLTPEYTELIKEELNVKEVVGGDETKLDTNITPALKAEGEYREFMRELQDQRKKLGLNPGDKMPMAVQTVYKKYRIFKGLQDHMLRVAAVAKIICDNFEGELNKKDILTACLLHDMGNIIKVDFTHFPEFFEPEGVEYWKNVKGEFEEKYKDKDGGHTTALLVARELGLRDEVVTYIDQVRFRLLCENSQEENMARKIIQYADGRVGPHGVVSYVERHVEADNRYKFDDKDRELVECGKRIEKQIFEHCKIKPEDITDEAIAPIVEELKNFVIE